MTREGSSFKDGRQQPAFPTRVNQYEQAAIEQHMGITIRDYFAAKAMQALVELYHPSIMQVDNVTRANVAVDAYAMADAMLEARK